MTHEQEKLIRMLGIAALDVAIALGNITRKEEQVTVIVSRDVIDKLSELTKFESKLIWDEKDTKHVPAIRVYGTLFRGP